VLPLTGKQQELLNFINGFAAQRGRAPSNWEICGHFGWKSDRAAAYQLQQLEAAGAIERKPIARGRGRAIKIDPPRPGRFPLDGLVAAGLPIDTEHEVGEWIDLAGMFAGEGVCAFRVRGDSMRDALIADGDVVLVRQCGQAEPGQVCVVWLNGGLTLKVFKVLRGEVWLYPRNLECKPIKVREGDDVRIVGELKGVVRKC
jgi:repressor LexA